MNYELQNIFSRSQEHATSSCPSHPDFFNPFQVKSSDIVV